jgi:nucleotidyltransferase/DNA polymerase involved in DNA repair
MLCKNFKTEFQKAKRLLEDKAIRFAAEATTRIGGRLLAIIESDGIAKFTQLTAFEDDDQLVQALKVAIRNAIDASAHMGHCSKIENDDERLQCYVAALQKLNRDQWRDEVGLFAARTLRQYIELAKGLKEKIGVIKIIVEGLLIATKK